MTDKEISGIWEAYKQVHTHQEEVEQLGEAQEARNDPEGYEERQRKSQSSRQRRMNDPHKGINSPAFHAFMAQQMGGKKKKDTNEQVEVDLFDTILEHLVAEGYADTNEAALAIMSNMSEEWREEIVEGMTMKDFKANRRKLQRKQSSDDAKKRGHVDKFTGKPYGTEEAASRRRNLNPAERESRRKFVEDPN